MRSAASSGCSSSTLRSPQPWLGSTNCARHPRALWPARFWSSTVRKVITDSLQQMGHRVLVAADGMQALARLNERIPDLVLLDVTMPHVDGFQLCRVIRANATTKDLPVVMLSGKDGISDKVRGRMVGATDWVTKPVDPATLLRLVELHARPQPRA